MDLKEIKARLRSVWAVEKALKERMEFLQHLEATAESVQGIDYSKDKTNGGPEHIALAEKVFRIIEVEEEIAKDIEEYKATLKAVNDMIRLVKDASQRELLCRRYQQGQKWEIIAAEMGYSWRQIHRLHGESLIEIQKKSGGE